MLVNTCAFVASAKKDSIDTLLAAADGGRKVVAVGCLAERYGAELAESLPEAAAVLGFDAYGEIGARLDDVLAGRPLAPHTPAGPAHAAADHPGRAAGARGVGARARPSAAEVPGWTPPVLRRRLGDAPVAPLKLASGCDRRCTFCAIPSFRGAFVSRPADELLAEAAWLAAQGVRELVLVSENSTSYGKDLGDLRLLERLLPELAAVPGIVRVRLSYLQPAETRPVAGRGARRHARRRALLRPVLPARQRAGAAPDAPVRRHRALPRPARPGPGAGAGGRASRSNVIVGFPGETEADLAELTRFLTAARLDAIGVFGYSDEDGTEAAGLRRQARAGRGRPPGRADRPARRGADGPAGRGAARRDRRGAGRGGHRRRRSRAGRRTRRRRSTGRRWSPARRWTAGRRPGPGEVTGTAGVDLTAATTSTRPPGVEQAVEPAPAGVDLRGRATWTTGRRGRLPGGPGAGGVSVVVPVRRSRSVPFRSRPAAPDPAATRPRPRGSSTSPTG